MQPGDHHLAGLAHLHRPAVRPHHLQHHGIVTDVIGALPRRTFPCPQVELIGTVEIADRAADDADSGTQRCGEQFAGRHHEPGREREPPGDACIGQSGQSARHSREAVGGEPGRLLCRCIIADGIDDQHLPPPQSHGQPSQPLVVAWISIAAEQRVDDSIMPADSIAAKRTPSETVKEPLLQPGSPNHHSFARRPAGGPIKQPLSRHIPGQRSRDSRLLIVAAGEHWKAVQILQ